METLNKKSQQIFFFCKGNGTTEFKMNPSTLLNKDSAVRLLRSLIFCR